MAEDSFRSESHDALRKREEILLVKTLSFVKGKGSLRHNNREFIASNIDADRISWNVCYCQQPLNAAYEEIFGSAVAEYNAKQKRNDRKINDYLTKIRNSGNKEKQFYETVVQIGKRDDTGVLDENGNLSEAARQAREVLDEYARTFQERNPNLILFNAVLHMDEATPHLHLDYIPVAHGYKTGLKTRNSLTKALQEMGIAPAAAKTDNETMHWQERERAYLMELCRDRGIEIEVLGVDRDSYSIPEYKQAMREKEAAEAEIEILNAEKAEITETVAGMDAAIESGEKEITDQQDLLNDIKERIAEAEKKVDERSRMLDKIMVAGKTVEKEIAVIREKVTVTAPLFGGESTVKIPKKTFDRLIDRYRLAGTFDNLSRQYERTLDSKQIKIDALTAEIQKWQDKYRRCTEFLKEHKLLEAFKEFIRPKTLREQLAAGKTRTQRREAKRETCAAKEKRTDIAI